MHKRILQDHIEVIGRMVGRKLTLEYKYNVPRNSACTDLNTIFFPQHLRWTSTATKKEYTILEHETSHILWKSNLLLLQKFGDEHSEYGDLASALFNVLEDHRCESLLSVLRKGSAYWFKKVIRDIWKDDQATDLLSTMVVTRGDMPKKASDKWTGFVPTIQEALKKVAFTTPEGTYVIAQWLWEEMEKYVDDIREQVHQEELKGKEGQRGTQQDDEGRGQNQGQDPQQQEGWQGNIQDPLEDSKESQQTTLVPDDSNGDDDSEEPTTPEELLKKLIEQGFDPLEIEDSVNSGEHERLTQKHRWDPQNFNESDLNPENLEDFLEQAKEQIQEYINELEQKMTEGELGENQIENHIQGSMQLEDYDIGFEEDTNGEIEDISDATHSKRLVKILQSIKNKSRDDLEIAGANLDVDAYITWRLDGMRTIPEIFEVEEEEQGFTMHIYVDCSGSMSGYPLESVKEVVATIMRATDQLPKINVEMYGWSSARGHDLHIQRAKNYKQVSLIHTTGVTPTNLAMQFATETMKRESADSKLIIFFTDGMPTYNTDRYIGDSQCRRAVRDAKKSGIDYFGILSSDYGGGDFMNRIFGKNYKALPLKNAIRYMEKIMQEHIKATLQR